MMSLPMIENQQVLDVTQKEPKVYDADEREQLVVEKMASLAFYNDDIVDPTIDLRFDPKASWLDITQSYADRYGVKIDDVLRERCLSGALNGPEKKYRVARFFIANRTGVTLQINKVSYTHGNVYEPNKPYGPVEPGKMVGFTLYHKKDITDVKIEGTSTELGNFTLRSNHLTTWFEYPNFIYMDGKNYNFNWTIGKGQYCRVSYCLYRK